MSNKRKVLSLFSGCGGMDLGFEGGFEVIKPAVNRDVHPDWIVDENDEWVRLAETGFETVFANDIEAAAKRAWERYFGRSRKVDGVYHIESVVGLVKADKANGSGFEFPRDIDVVTGGFPCNDFSLAGKRLGFNSHKTHDDKFRGDEPSVESRGQLYMWMKEVVELTKPKVFLAENVKGLMSLDDAKDVIENDFRQIAGGYVVVPARVLRAPEYGVPQTRHRVIFIGFRKNALKKAALKALTAEKIPIDYDPYPRVTHGGGELMPYTSVRMALDGLPEPAESNDLTQKSYSKAKFMGTHCQGQKEINLDKPAPTIRAEHHGNIEYRRLSRDNGGLNFDELDAGLKERRLTVRECARIQTFPDDYEFVIKNPGERRFVVNTTDAYRMIGNAVPPFLAYHLAKRIEALWERLFA